MSLHALGLNVAPVFVPGSYTVDTLPDPSAWLGMYARVTDLFGSKRDLVLASQDSTGNYWQPVRPVYKGVVPLTSDMTLTPLKSPSIISYTGSILVGAARVVSLSNQLVFPGATFTVRTKLTNLLGTLKILDTVTGLLSSLAVNNSYTFVYDPINGWEQI